MQWEIQTVINLLDYCSGFQYIFRYIFCCDFENGNYWSGSCNRYQPAFILYFYSGIFNEKPGKLSCKTT